MNSQKALVAMKINRWGNAYFEEPQEFWIDQVTKEQISELTRDLLWLNNRIALVLWALMTGAELASRIIVQFVPGWFSWVLTVLTIVYACYGWFCHKVVTKRLQSRCKQNSDSNLHWELEEILYCAVWRDASISVQRQQ
jgi:hypothetical protein